LSLKASLHMAGLLGVLLLGFDDDLFQHKGLDIHVVDIAITTLMISEGGSVVAGLSRGNGQSDVSVDEFGSDLIDLDSVKDTLTLSHLDLSVAHDGFVSGFVSDDGVGGDLPGVHSELKDDLIGVLHDLTSHQVDQLELQHQVSLSEDGLGDFTIQLNGVFVDLLGSENVLEKVDSRRVRVKLLRNLLLLLHVLNLLDLGHVGLHAFRLELSDIFDAVGDFSSGSIV